MIFFALFIKTDHAVILNIAVMLKRIKMY